jgi:hypothetical protein
VKRWTGNISPLTGIEPITPTLTPGRRRYSTVMQVSRGIMVAGTPHTLIPWWRRYFIVMQVSMDHGIIHSTYPYTRKEEILHSHAS